MNLLDDLSQANTLECAFVLVFVFWCVAHAEWETQTCLGLRLL